MFKIVIYYKTKGALKKYLEQFNLNERYESWLSLLDYKEGHFGFFDEDVTIECVDVLNKPSKGKRAHIIAVQEDLTWGDQWGRIKEQILEPMIISPIPIQIFDGV